MGATRTSAGVVFNDKEQRLQLLPLDTTNKLAGYTWEFDIDNFDFKGNKNYHIRFLNATYKLTYATTTYQILGSMTFRANSTIGWCAYGCSSSSLNTNNMSWSTLWSNELSGNSDAVINAFNGKTVKMVFDSDGITMSLYIDNVLIGTKNDLYFEPSSTYNHVISIGAIDDAGFLYQAEGDQCYDMTISGIRVYRNI